MKPASIAVLLFLASLSAVAAPSSFTLSGAEKCWTSDPPPRPGAHLAWTASVNAVRFDVFRQGQFVETIPFGGSGTYDETTNGFFVGATVSYYMVAHDNSGGTFTSNTVDIHITGDVCQAPPAAPVLDGSAACDAAGPSAFVNLTWSGSTTATSYRISRTPTTTGFPVDITSSTYTDTTVNPGTTYTYKITATNSGGSTDSNAKVIDVSSTICSPAAPAISANATCLAGPPATAAVHVSWTTVSFATSYVVSRGGTAISAALPADATSFDDINITAGQTYSYTVTASNNQGSATSAAAQATVTNLPCIANPPGAFSASANGGCSAGSPVAHVSWTASAGATSYVVNRNGTPVSSTLSSSTDHYDDPTVGPGVSYTYTVTASNSGGKTTSSSASSGGIPFCSDTNPPPDFNASAGAFCNSGVPAVHVAWAPSLGATYVVNRNGINISGTLATSGSGGQSFDDTTVTSGQTYTYAVVATNSNGSTTAQAGSVTLSANDCPPPAFTLTASATCNPIVSPPQPMVTLSWTAAATATSYLILRDSAQIASVSASTNNFNDTPGAGTYHYVVRAVGPGGSTDSNTATVTVLPNLCGTPRPDLAATDISTPPPVAQPGDTFVVSITVTNASDAAAAPATASRIRIGTGTTVSPSDPIVAGIAIPPLAAGASTMQTATVTIPNLPPGTYYLFLSVDDDHIAGDINASNDVKRSAAITAQSPPCTLACGAIVSSTAQAATPVAFALERPPCVNDRAVWTFGDSTTATSYSPTHVYATTGTFHWTLTLTSATGETCSSSGNITVTAPTVPPKRRAVHH
jgi:fibronectin type 3 domain-containing protein